MLKNRVGEEYTTSQGYTAQIIAYRGSKSCDILLKEVNYKIYNRQFVDISKGEISYPCHPSFLNVGYLGIGVYTFKSNKTCTRMWRSMLSRCYYTIENPRNRTYKNTTVCEEWHDFQNFSEWFYEHYDANIMKNWHLDKDIICRDCKQYSPETCSFVPPEINYLLYNNTSGDDNLPTGVYTSGNKYGASCNKKGEKRYIGVFDSIEEAHKAYCEDKKKYVIKVAEKWKNEISLNVYNALINFNIASL